MSLQRAVVRWRIPRSARAYAGLALVGLTFVVSRILYAAEGVTFDASSIPWFSQLLDPPLLQHRLLESLLYLHAQPPFYNLLTGVALKLAPDAPARVLHPFFMLCSLYLGCSANFILLRLRVHFVIAALVAAAITASPPVVLFENWYFYPHLNVTWLVGGVAWLAASRGRPGVKLLIASGHFAGLVLTRSLFHPLFFVLIGLVVVWLLGRGRRGSALKWFAAPGLLVAAWCLKNELLFDFPGTSSWSSRNFSHAVVSVLEPRLIHKARRHHRFSRAIRTDWFAPGDVNIAVFKLHRHGTGIPALDQITKTTPPHMANFNHFSYPETQRFYADDARTLLVTYPFEFLRALPRTTIPIFFRPVTSSFMDANIGKIPNETAAFNRFEASASAHTLLGGGLLLALLRVLGRRTPRAERVTWAVMLLTILWVTCVGIVGENGENYRFRYNVLWLAWLAATAGYSAFAPHAVRLTSAIRRAFTPTRADAC